MREIAWRWTRSAFAALAPAPRRDGGPPLPLACVHVVLVAEPRRVVVRRDGLGRGQLETRPDDRVRDVAARGNVALPLDFLVRAPRGHRPRRGVRHEARNEDRLVTVYAFGREDEPALGGGRSEER